MRHLVKFISKNAFLQGWDFDFFGCIKSSEISFRVKLLVEENLIIIISELPYAHWYI